jgi:hypothetical protein
MEFTDAASGISPFATENPKITARILKYVKNIILNKIQDSRNYPAIN